MTASTFTYADFVRLREQAADVIKAIADAFARLGAGERAKQINTTRDTLLNDTFKVLIVGEFKHGKSTFINAMLGESILPAKVAPCTAIITRVSYGDTKVATLYFKDGRDPLHLDLERNPDSLRTHVAIDHTASAEASRETPYLAAEVHYPLALCRDNVEIVDSPGLNEDSSRTEITRQFMGASDAMVMVLSCDKQLAQTEVHFIDEQLKDRDLTDVFFVWNRFDAVQDSPSDVADLKDLSRHRLESKVGGRARVFYVSARDGLLGRIKGDRPLLDKSNLPQFEAALEAFLATERGRVKLRSPLRVAEHAIHEGLVELVPYREALFRKPLEELRRQLEQQRPRLDEVERQRDRILRSIERRAEAMVRELEASLRTVVMAIELGLRKKAQEIDVSLWETMRSKPAVQEKLTGILGGWVEQQFTNWKDTVATELIQMHVADLTSDLADQGKSLLGNIDAIKASFDASFRVDSTTPSNDATILSRITGAGLGILMFHPGLAVEGATSGLKNFATAFGVHIATATGLMLLGAPFVPVILPVLFAVGVGRTALGLRSAATQIRDRVITDISSALRGKLPGMERDLSAHITEQTDALHRTVGERMTVLVDEVRGQVQKVISDREQHEKTASSAGAELEAVRMTLVAQSKLLGELRGNLERD